MKCTTPKVSQGRGGGRRNFCKLVISQSKLILLENYQVLQKSSSFLIVSQRARIFKKQHRLPATHYSFATMLPAHIPASHSVVARHLSSRRAKQSHFPLKLVVKHIHTVIHVPLCISFVKQGHSFRGTECSPPALGCRPLYPLFRHFQTISDTP